MSRHWIITIAVVVAVVVVALAFWMERPAPLTPSADHTQGVAPQAMLWTPTPYATASS